jgi:hypothetical protein
MRVTSLQPLSVRKQVLFHEGPTSLIALQIFNFEKWRKHRSPWKYVEQIASIPWSHTVRSIAFPLTWTIVVTVLVGLHFSLSARHLLPTWASLPPLSSPRASLSSNLGH